MFSMWPKLLDLPKEQCAGLLRNIECQAYTSLVDAYRAGGVLTEEKKSSLESVAAILNISVDRHKAEVRRAVNDELLNTISERLCGLDQTYSWAKEGRRIIPLLPRSLPVTSLTSLAGEAAHHLSQHNSRLSRPSQTRSSVVPVLSKPDHLMSPSSLTNGLGEGPAEVSAEEDGEGVVVLPSGTMVRVSAKSTSRGGRGGKRRRSSSKCYEVLPAVTERGENSPPRKISSVLGAGHGYARPLPGMEPSLGGCVRVRGPGRPPGPQLTVGAASVYHQVTGRGRPRLMGGQVRARVSRGRGGVLITPRLPSQLPQHVPVPTASVVSTRLALRPTSVASPRATTIQLKQESPAGLQGLKVISHSNTKIVPKSATAVYVVPSSQQRILAGQRLVNPHGLPGVIKTVRPGKPSVIVVQKGSGLPAVSGGVALYRPARALVCNPRAVSSAPPTSSNNLILVNISQSDTATTTTNVGPTITTTLENKDLQQNGEAQQTTDRTEPNGSDQDIPDTESETNNGDLEPGHVDGENNERTETTIFSSKKVTLPPRPRQPPVALDLAEEAETEETIPTYDLSTGENITNVLESEILENNQDIIESNGKTVATQE